MDLVHRHDDDGDFGGDDADARVIRPSPLHLPHLADRRSSSSSSLCS